MKYYDQGIAVLNEYLKQSGLNMTATQLADKASSAGANFINSIGYTVMIAFDGDQSRLESAMSRLVNVAGKNIPISDMFFEAIRNESESHDTFDIIKFAVTEAAADAGAIGTDFANASLGVIKIVTFAAPLVVLAFVGAKFFEFYKSAK